MLNKTAIVLLLFTCLFIFLPRYIKVKRITCKSQFGPCGERIEKKIKESEGQSLYQAKKRLNNFFKNEVSINDYGISFGLPNQLKVSIVTRKPQFGLFYTLGKAVALVDQEGYVLSFQEDTSLPVLEVEERPPALGERLSDEMIFALRILSDMYEFYQTPKGELKEESLIIELKGKETVIFPLEGDREILIGSLSVILAKLNEGGDDTRIRNRVIDLRFKNPVIRN